MTARAPHPRWWTARRCRPTTDDGRTRIRRRRPPARPLRRHAGAVRPRTVRRSLTSPSPFGRADSGARSNGPSTRVRHDRGPPGSVTVRHPLDGTTRDRRERHGDRRRPVAETGKAMPVRSTPWADHVYGQARGPFGRRERSSSVRFRFRCLGLTRERAPRTPRAPTDDRGCRSPTTAPTTTDSDSTRRPTTSRARVLEARSGLAGPPRRYRLGRHLEASLSTGRTGRHRRGVREPPSGSRLGSDRGATALGVACRRRTGGDRRAPVRRSLAHLVRVPSRFAVIGPTDRHD